MTEIAARTGTVQSGDVSLWYRCFGSGGACPLLFLHGANYYDSRDWVEVAAALATDRQVCAFDARGHGLSGWSEAGEYSDAAALGDIAAVLDYLAWPKAILAGHSRGGGLALRYAELAPERVAGLVLIDFSPGRTPRRADAGKASRGKYGTAYASLELAHADTSRYPAELESEAGRARVESFFAQRDGGWVNIRRDPASTPGNRSLPGEQNHPVADLWEVLGQAVARGVPCEVIRGTRSRGYDEAALARLTRDFPEVGVTAVDSGHDLVGEAPGPLTAALRLLLDATSPLSQAGSASQPHSGRDNGHSFVDTFASHK